VIQNMTDVQEEELIHPEAPNNLVERVAFALNALEYPNIQNLNLQTRDPQFLGNLEAIIILCENQMHEDLLHDGEVDIIQQ